jgi:hypothetical protein
MALGSKNCLAHPAPLVPLRRWFPRFFAWTAGGTLAAQPWYCRCSNIIWGAPMILHANKNVLLCLCSVYYCINLYHVRIWRMFGARGFRNFWEIFESQNCLGVSQSLRPRQCGVHLRANQLRAVTSPWFFNDFLWFDEPLSLVDVQVSGYRIQFLTLVFTSFTSWCCC